ncbi:MAG: hypothetical protein ACOYZ6_17290 [Chloroflexota bacterium]
MPYEPAIGLEVHAVESSEIGRPAMQKLKSFFLSSIYFIIFCVLGLIVGTGIAYGFLILGGQGVFSSWELLKGDHQFEKIITVDNQTVWAQASDGKVYSWNTNCYRKICNQWTEVEDTSNSIDSLEIDDSCKMDEYFLTREPRGNLIECARVDMQFVDAWGTTYYALLGNGNILMWEYSNNSISIEVMPFISASWGLIAGALGFIFFTTRKSLKNKNRSITTV